MAPGQTKTVHITMRAQRDWPADMRSCRDKFMVKSGAMDVDELRAPVGLLTQSTRELKAPGDPTLAET